jgi:hypothetical protein
MGWLGEHSKQAMGLTISKLMFNSWQGLEIFLLSTVCKLAMGPNQPPTQSLLGIISPGV